MSPAIRRQLATAYTRMLRMSTAAEKRGLDKQPKFDEMMHFARMQILSQELSRALQEDSGKVTDADIEDYYKKNEASYEQATFARIFVPRRKANRRPQRRKAEARPAADARAAKTSAPQPPTEAQKKAAEEAMTKLAASLQARAAKGEDPDKLQKEAYVAAGLPGNAPEHKDGEGAPHHAAREPSGGHGSEARRSVRGDLRFQQRLLHLQTGQQRNVDLWMR